LFEHSSHDPCRVIFSHFNRCRSEWDIPYITPMAVNNRDTTPHGIESNIPRYRNRIKTAHPDRHEGLSECRILSFDTVDQSLGLKKPDSFGPSDLIRLPRNTPDRTGFGVQPLSIFAVRVPFEEVNDVLAFCISIIDVPDFRRRDVEIRVRRFDNFDPLSVSRVSQDKLDPRHDRDEARLPFISTDRVVQSVNQISLSVIKTPHFLVCHQDLRLALKLVRLFHPG